jgi:hypothetical protein
MEENKEGLYKEKENMARPAFPTNARMHTTAQGLTEREHFAAMALQGLLPLIDRYGDPIRENICADAVAFADELLTQLSK